MAEIKRTFTTARMNKDVDERLVANGEYRDAMNIQIRTTDGDAAGTVQNIQGNTLVAFSPVSTPLLSDTDSDGDAQNKCIGSVVDERNDRSFFLFAAPEFNVDFTAASSGDTIGNNIGGRVFYIDTISEIRANNFAKTVINDFYATVGRRSDYSITATVNTNTINTSSGIGQFFRVGQRIQLYNSSGASLLKNNTKITGVQNAAVTINSEITSGNIDASTCSFVKVWGERVLNFNQKNLITAINVIDDFLFFTDGVSEPKKVNIRRSKNGSPKEYSNLFSLLLYTHTHLSLDDQINKTPVSISEYGSGTENDDLLEEHITVIRKAPRTAPSIIMSDSPRAGNVDFNVVTGSLVQYNFMNANSDTVLVLTNQTTGNENFSVLTLSLVAGDIVTLTSTSNQTATDRTIRARVDMIDADNEPNTLILQVISSSNNLTISDTEWHGVLEQTKPFFELKFPRFGYRYKYNDGEYSSFSPFSEVAFLPKKYDYEPKEGYNLGMTNNLRHLKVTNFLPEESMRPDDIETVDILYKSTDSPVVYVVKSINRDIDPEWSGAPGVTANEVVITSDMVYKALPSNQILRSFDNVPRFAKSQEIIANRLIYANYTQGFDVVFNPGVQITLNQKTLANFLEPEKSIKSLRTYKVGLVYGDKYGRETPVISPGDRVLTGVVGSGIDALGKYSKEISDTVNLSKADSITSNKIKVKQHWTDGTTSYIPPGWIDYVKFYIKETSGEYYNMLQHRWYDAEDGNIWLAFGSSDRNKIDEESYLVLKKKHGSNEFVEEEARYKVLDISNEAPEFVKTIPTRIGEMAVSEADNVYNTATDIEELAFRTEFNITDYSLFYYQNMYQFVRGFQQLQVRIRAHSRDTNGNIKTTAYTSYQKVIRFDDDEAETFNIEYSFGDEAKFVNYFVSIGDYVDDGTGTNGANNTTTGIDYHFEFKALAVENKPEFDGRFLLK